MSSLHGMWSAGGFTGASVGGLFAQQGVPPSRHLVIVAALLVLMLVVAKRWLPPTAPHAPDAGPRFARPEATLAGLGAIIFCSFLVEGAMADWTAVLLHDVLGTSAALAALGYSAYSVTMMTMRFAGDRVVARWGAEPLLRRATAVAALAFASALASANVAVTLVAVACIGVGVATVAPLVFGAAARRSHHGAGRGIAAMATLGYGGFLLGPAVIGWLAQMTGLRAALTLLALLLAAMSALAHHLREPPHPQT
jgi:fucose permease